MLPAGSRIRSGTDQPIPGMRHRDLSAGAR